ncbi:MAG: PepSY-associated TM helix domain-containing protein [Nostoc sp.]|uniref:PepSY-associated TM helix domain-containing protein n=1 Tax=Nostoc sp. TaxID=1180 RepID=UPI002FFC6EB1
MNRKIVRTITFQLHRWLGLVVGILLCIAGLTGSVLVFEQEIDNFLLERQMGHIVPTNHVIPLETLVNTVNSTYASTPGFKLGYVEMFEGEPYEFRAETAKGKDFRVFVNPYTGKVMGDRIWDDTWLGFTFKLHYALLAGETGILIMGIVALVTLILSITGIVLWPGWRRLISGFKIKWDGHIKRVNFDIHKVAGIITAIFLTFIGFTGFAWNVPQAKVEDVIYAATFTSKPPNPVSHPIPGKQPLSLIELLQRADAAVPNAPTTGFFFPIKPEDVLWLGKKKPGETSKGGSIQLFIDQFSGKVLRIQDGLNPTRAEVILNSFSPLHYGTFGGLATRILYVFVGLVPSILFITGFVMWWYRYRVKLSSSPKQLWRMGKG